MLRQWMRTVKMAQLAHGVRDTERESGGKGRKEAVRTDGLG